MASIDSVELTIPMTKYEGTLPRITDMKASSIKKLFALTVNADAIKDLGYTHYRIIKAGEKSDSLRISDGKLEGFPTLKVRIYRYPDFMGNKADVFGKDRAAAGGAFLYNFGGSESDCYFLDANGETQALRIMSEMKSPDYFDDKLRSKCVEL
jgi:hypothetical protein